tara:strand:- start:334 stop:510 length:177 start_codon:yes stop_codon:yes gene_type:complete
MDDPDTWDWTHPLRWDDFVTSPDITIVEMLPTKLNIQVAKESKPLWHNPDITECELCE